MSKLDAILTGIDWNDSVASFAAQHQVVERYQRGCHLLAVWVHELRFQEPTNPATPFLMEMQASAGTAPTCASLGLYKPAAASMRAAVENALYFSFFVNHPVELQTQLRRDDYYESKKTIIEYHKKHSIGFNEKQQAVGLLSELDSWYSEISAIIHGQKPGIWSTRGISNTAFNSKLDQLSVDAFSRCISIINMLFLIVIEDELWDGFNPRSRGLFLKGYSKQKKQIIGRSLV